MVKALWDTENQDERRQRLAADRAGEAHRVGVLLMAQFKPGIELEPWTDRALHPSDMEFAVDAVRLLASRGEIRVDRSGAHARYLKGTGMRLAESRTRASVAAQLARVPAPGYLGRCYCGCGGRTNTNGVFIAGHLEAGVELLCHAARHGLLTARGLLDHAEMSPRFKRAFMEAVESGLANPIGNEPGLG